MSIKFVRNLISNKEIIAVKAPSLIIALFLFKLLVFYFILNYFFLAYTGLMIPGGKGFSPFLLEHADFISVFRRFLLWGAAQFATLIGYRSGYTDYTMFVYGGSSVRMIYSCMGFSLMSAYAALVLAWSAALNYRLISLLVGTATIIILNMIRLGGLAILYSTKHSRLFQYIDHHDLFNIVMLVVVFIMFTAHVKYSARKESKEVEE